MAETVQAAPAELELVRQFVNTNDIDDGIEELATPDRLKQWLADHGLEPGSGAFTGGDLRRAIDMREALRALLLANSGEPLAGDAVETLNAAADRARLGVRFDFAGHAALSAQAGGADGALGTLLEIVFRSMADGTWSRLKACRESTCQWAFFDKSKNRSAHWCTMAVCGNRAKARSYRSRQRASA